MISVGTYVVVLLLLVVAASIRTRATKQRLLLGASYLFYGTFGIAFLGIILASSVFNFRIGAWLRRQPTPMRLWVGILFNVCLLGCFKYVPSASLTGGIVMPVGMSFWTFQALSYLFDLYREEDVDPSLTEFCLYMAFWPTVLMGPICRLPSLLPQFREIRSVPLADFTEGIRRICLGLFMKLILAELLAAGVNSGFGSAQPADGAALHWSGLDVWFLAVGFGFQLFFDFAGYSHIAIGAARLFGFRLEENFDAPYLATNPSIFWTKWHMSLSSWIRDYVFVPIATLRRDVWWRYFAVWCSMVLFGIWHGFQLTYLFWGVYHGALLVIHRIGQQLQRKSGFIMDGRIALGLSWIVTFLSVSLGWIAFRANDLNQTAVMYQAILSPQGYWQLILPASYYPTVIALVGGYFTYNVIISRISLIFERHVAFLFNRLVSESSIGKAFQFLWENSWLWAVPTLALLAIWWALVVSVHVSPFVYRGF